MVNLIEVEIKVQISNPDLLRQQFKEQDGVYKFSLLHEDTYFNMPKRLRDFKISDEALRLRKSIEYNKYQENASRKIFYYITYKGKKIDKTTKTREEIDIKIENLEDMKTLLKNLGFQEIFTIRKERELYEFYYKNYKIEALIDYLPILKQYFIEVELLSDSLEEVTNSKNLLFDFLSLFNIKKEESIRRSYLELIADKFKGKLK